MPSCLQCYSVVTAVYQYFWKWVWHWISATLQECSDEDCDWWVLCLNKVFCWIVTGLIFVFSLVLFVVLELVVTVLCTAISVWCVACRSICWAGCLGDEKCWRNCVENGPCDGPDVQIDTDFPTASVKGMFSGRSKSKVARAEQMQRADRQVIELSQVGDLDAIVGSGLAGWLGHRRRVSVVLKGASSASSRRLQSIADRYVAACGCKEGQLGLLTGVLITLVQLQHAASVTGGEIVSAVGVAAAGAILGKAFGLAKSRVDFVRGIREFGHL